MLDADPLKLEYNARFFMRKIVERREELPGEYVGRSVVVLECGHIERNRSQRERCRCYRCPKP